MKYMTVLDIQEGKAPDVKIEAFGKNSATMIIQAASLQEALKLAAESEAAALDAMSRWEPEDAPIKKDPLQTHSAAHPAAEEGTEDALANHEERDDGRRRFLHSIETARNFTQKKDTSGGLSWSQLNYIANLPRKDIYNGMIAIYDIAYRRGYNKAKSAKKKGGIKC